MFSKQKGLFLVHVLEHHGLALLHFAFFRDPYAGLGRGIGKGTGHTAAGELSACMWPVSLLHTVLVR